MESAQYSGENAMGGGGWRLRCREISGFMDDAEGGYWFALCPELFAGRKVATADR